MLSGLFFLNACSETPSLTPLDKNSVILAFGDSLTEGKGAAKGNSYSDFLQAATGIKVINKGISGEVSDRGLKRLKSVLDQTRPNLVILCYGGNDILRNHSAVQLKQNLRSMIEMIRARHIDIVLIGVPAKSLFLSSHQLYAELAEEYKIPIENDIISSLIKSNQYKSDSVHPNALGYQKMAQAVEQLLQENGAL